MVMPFKVLNNKVLDSLTRLVIAFILNLFGMSQNLLQGILILWV
jgi:hypothetical protein